MRKGSKCRAENRCWRLKKRQLCDEEDSKNRVKVIEGKRLRTKKLMNIVDNQAGVASLNWP